MTNPKTSPVAGNVVEQLATETVERVEIARLTLCGSTRFRAEYELWNKRLTLAGFLVYSVSGFGHSGDVFTDEEKRRLDQIHLAKIDASHAIVVINPDGYIGDSTKREIEHAQLTGKRVYYTHSGMPTVYQLRTGPDGGASLRYRAFSYDTHPTEDDTLTDAGEGVEPVAWMLRNSATGDVLHGCVWGNQQDVQEAADQMDGREAFALYAHPSPTDTGLVGELDFDAAWATKEAEGYQYGEDALEQVRLGWEMARTALSKAKDTPHG